ncbi:MAG: SRPBCC family protein [Acidobacteria bacterium]|nr:SRPBCC family protein [Acidobacteriota bacterium]
MSYGQTLARARQRARGATDTLSAHALRARDAAWRAAPALSRRALERAREHDRELLLLGAGALFGAGLALAVGLRRRGPGRMVVRDHDGRVLRRSGSLAAAEVPSGTGWSIGSPDKRDRRLERRVRARIERALADPGAVDIVAHEGCVSLRGRVGPDEIENVLRRAISVRGVTRVENHLEQRAAEDPAGAAEAPLRVMSALAGGGLVYFGVRRRDAAGLAAAGLGMAALWGALRSGAGRARRRQRSRQRASAPPIDVHHGFHIDAPPNEIWPFFEDLENWPRFLGHVRSVRRVDGHRTHWTAAGPTGVVLEWDAALTEVRPNRLLSWRSVEGAPVGSSGTVRLEPAPGGGTRVSLVLHHVPPAGLLGEAFAALFDGDATDAIAKDLERCAEMLRPRQSAP